MSAIPGFEMVINTGGLTVGQEAAFGFDAKNSAVTALFHPSLRPMSEEGMTLGFASYAPGGSGRIPIESLEARENGRIKGKLVYAKMRAFQYNMRTGRIPALSRPMT
ncbi:MAG: hypothetical protein QME74_05905 [Candidatus Edwardsbacteria bacterium]|nr:hypothetical protein [Candidatus Edwardsbacteria bacterium]